MADSDDEFERKNGRDKFRRERNDYERRSDDRRRDNWDDRRPSARGGQRGWRGNLGATRRDAWSNRGNNMRDHREIYSRGYDDRRRDRVSPGRYDSNSHPAKRIRRDWDDTRYPSMYDSPFQVSNGPPGAERAGWNHRGMEVSNGPPEYAGYKGRRDQREVDFQTQPPMMTFKQFLNKQDDAISQEDATKLYDSYQLEFKRQQVTEFFLAHKEEEWFKSKYHPEESEKQQAEVKSALQARKAVFESLREKKFFNDVSVDVDDTDKLTKILDAKGGNDFDLTILDNPVQEPGEGSQHNSESSGTVRNNEVTSFKKDGEDGELSDSNDAKDADEKDTEQEKTSADTKNFVFKKSVSPEQEQQKKAMDCQKKQEVAAEVKAERRKKRSQRKNSDYSYESDTESGSGSDSDTRPVPPGLEDDLCPPGVQSDKPDKDYSGLEGDNRKGDREESTFEIKEKVDEVPKPRPLHLTSSIFLRNLAPSITKQEVVALCKRYPGFKRVALQDPQPERRFFRRGWVTFSHDCNIKEVCWNLNNIRLRECELGAILNRELKQRIRATNGITVHKQVMQNDIKLAAKLIQILDKKYHLWEEAGQEKKDEEKEPQFGFVSKNPVLKNITDYLVEEGSYEEDELIGEPDEERKDVNLQVTVEKDESLSQVLDRMVFYLRLVHSIDYYSANEYTNEDEMPHRCGIMHTRGPPPGSAAKLLQNDVNEWITIFEKKIKPLLETCHQISDTEAIQLGKKDPDAEVEKFVQANTQELSKDKWLCPLSGKKFKGPDFIRKHIFNKYQEKIDDVKQEVKFFNNYLMDSKKPSLPEHPSNRPKSSPSPLEQRADPYGSYPSQESGGVYGAARPPLQGSGGSGVYQSPFTVRDTRPPPETFRRTNFGGAAPSYRRSDPRQLTMYTDLDAPDDGSLHK